MMFKATNTNNQGNFIGPIEMANSLKPRTYYAVTDHDMVAVTGDRFMWTIAIRGRDLVDRNFAELQMPERLATPCYYMRSLDTPLTVG